MESQKKLINEKNWDILIILDACRYDYFKNLYESYLKGNLRKVESAGLGTEEWFDKSFSGDYYDTIYISANPHINSKGIKGSKAKNLFYDVVDVWDWGWEKKVDSVPPKRVNESVLEVIEKYPKKKIIAHYLQPHYPYISFQGEEGKVENKSFISFLSLGRGIRNKVGNLLDKIFPKGIIEELRKTSNSTRPITKSTLIQEKGFETLRKFYEDDLKLALKNISNLVKKLRGKIIISSDHGELLGEEEKHGHGYDMPENRNVPWLEVNS